MWYSVQLNPKWRGQPKRITEVNSWFNVTFGENILIVVLDYNILVFFVHRFVIMGSCISFQSVLQLEMDRNSGVADASNLYRRQTL